MNWIFILLGAALTVNGALMSVVSNFNIGVILTLLAGLFFLGWGIFYKKIKEATKKGFLRAVKYAVIFALAAVCAETAFLACYAAFDNTDGTEDAVIVLGAGVHGENPSMPLVLRLKAAKRYYDKNNDALIVVTGAKGFQEDISEAEAMEKYLIGLGVPKESILKEDKAHNTYENLMYSKKILDEKLGNEYSAAVITNSFHIFRAVGIAKNVGLRNIRHYHAETSWYNWAPCYLRECLAVVKFFVTGR